MPNLQKTITLLRQHLFRRGWARCLLWLAKINPQLRTYKAFALDNDHYFVDLSNAGLGMELFCYGEIASEKGTYSVFTKTLSPGDKMIDVGANIGYYSRIASRLVGNHGQVYSFEPSPAALRLLRLNTEHLQNVNIVPYAVSDKNTSVKFYVHSSQNLSSLGSVPGTHTINVQAVTLDSAIPSTEPIAFIKIDVEGFELQVLKGARHLISTHQPIVYFEFLQSYAEEFKFNLNDFIEFFESISLANYRLFWTNNEPSETELLLPLTINHGNNIIAIPAKKLFLFQNTENREWPQFSNA